MVHADRCTSVLLTACMCMEDLWNEGRISITKSFVLLVHEIERLRRLICCDKIGRMWVGNK